MSMTKARTPLAVLTLSGVLFTPFWVALAEPSKTPRIEGAMPIEWQSDFAHHSDDATNERNNMFIKAEPEITLYLPAGFSIFAHGVLQQVKAAGPDEDRYFKDEALLIEDLFLRYENGPFILTGGKLNPGFGKAWDVTPGVYGADTAEDYEIAERIGLTAAFGFGDEIWGQHQFTAGTFFTDTTPLAHSFGQTRGTTALSDGGVSNTEDFSSFNLVLEGSGIQSLPGLEYHLAYISQANGTDGTTDETGVAAFAAYGFDFGGVRFTPMAELARFKDSGGTRDTDKDYNTLALSAEWKGWNGALSYTGRETQAAGASDVRDHFYQVGLGYSFDIGINADIAWKRARESAVETDTVGSKISYQFTF
ncbi:MAG: hypothetical protein HN377_09565 [Alphaproteobacteria bacterium]|nr:hypothetical protein [Alphaproteobacteria bacterium]MBT7944067.1 hypothetical protein [Alphaproteobacteria bacterium]